ncbi:SCO0930 family lipoprotein [Streptomyces sp. HNM0663]|uniref:SCO0930 family lipoprotein n=1 Tax=Streptomyces chengmaiensis TaxID=3040919 RepID=A0ABT6HGU9_9ACTN|nr:SCO0930 family lipoprotein [Streptomyces chengmaiensis]MDH2387987.1 SCO0930 family lipoprotein [Streptomyces chengmaiensis]
MNTWRNASLAVTAAAVLALTTACGQDNGAETPNGQAVGAANPAGQPADAGYGAGGGYGSGAEAGGAAAAKPAGQLAVRKSGDLGEVLTDSAGFTLYRFDKDTPNPPKSNCEGDCAKAWPVVSAEGAAAPPGVDASLMGEVTRSDGTKQLTIDGWPMYRYAKDTKAGDVNGQGVGGTWFASAPDGKKAEAGAGGGEDGGEDVAGGGGDDKAPADLAGLSVRKDPKLGEVVVDKNGMTVYGFTKDSPWPMKTACKDDCLKKWPVVAPVDPDDMEGITVSKRGNVTFNRPDGIKQQTIDCRPLYTFAGDTKPGDTNGQGVGGSWYAVGPDGKLVGAPE